MNLARYDLNLLVALDALLDERNVTHAGDRLGMSQSAMSGVLSRLRYMFNDELLVRVGRNMERTPLADELIEPLRTCIQNMQVLLNSHLSFDPASDKHTFTIATSDYLSFLLLAPLLERLLRISPGISLRIVQVDETRLDQLAEGKIDFIIMPAQISTSLPSQVLFEDHWVCAVWKDHPDIGTDLSLKQYVELPHLVCGQSNSGVADEHLARMGVKRTIGASVQSFLLAPFVIQNTNMATLLHRRLGERLSLSTNIRLMEPPLDLPPIYESIFWNPRNTSNPPHVWLLQQITEISGKL